MKGLIACTQPRRVAAITVAMRVSEETNTQLGQLVGYSVRFEDVTSQDTKIKYMTDGMLLREAINDSLLQRYSVIILDEIHERTIHTDVLLGIVKQAQKERMKGGLKPLKIILMSATMDVDLFSKYFNQAPVLYLEGRQYPIDIYHSAQSQNDYLYASIVAVLQIHKLAPLNEDILLFLTGQEEIESTVKTLNDLNKNNRPLLALPLYASLPQAKQLKVFEKAPPGVRKVIVSTNIAETSITIKNIKYVIDSGMIKGKLFNSQSNLEVLKVHKISKSQAWQRSGRAGREPPRGVCYRLYTENEYENLPASTIPELLRSNLASVILQLLAIGIKSPHAFDFIDKPDESNIKAAIHELELLGAVKLINDTEYELTKIGRKMSQFPLDPKYAKCILSAEQYECVEDVLKIVSLLSVDSVFVSNLNKNSNFNTIKDKFTSADGDHITLLNVFKAFISAKLNKVCRFV
jgi:ATP-dependent RNA helicase DHX33